MKKYDRLIFVSSSDTALGPMAEAILQSKFLLEELEITSKGVVVLFPEPINPKAEAVLVSNGLTMKNHMSDPLLIPVLNEYVGVREGISNPYGGSLADYGKCFAELEALIAKLVVQLNEEELLC